MEILNFSLCLVECFAIYTFFNSLFTNRFQHIFVTLIVVLINATFLYYFANLHIVIKSILGVFSIMIGNTILYKEKVYVKTVFSVTLLFILSITDVIFGNLFSIIFSKQFISVFYSSLINRLIVCYVIKIIDIILFYFIYKSFKKVNLKMRKREWILFNIIMFIFWIITLTFMTIFPQKENDNSIIMLFLIISMAFLTMSLIVIYFFTEICASFQSQKRLYLLESNYAMLKEQLTVQNQTSQKLSKIRHDIKNHLININMLISNGEINNAQQLLKQINEETNNISIELSQTTNNSIIDSIVLYKASLCENKNIQFEYSLEPLPNIKINIIDLSSALSNLLDNAIEASNKTNNPFVNLKIFVYKGYLTFVVKNSFSGEISDNNNKLITLKKDFKNHGYGTEIINEIAEKYEGKYSWEIHNKIFKSTVIVSI